MLIFYLGIHYANYLARETNLIEENIGIGIFSTKICLTQSFVDLIQVNPITYGGLD